MEHEDKKEIPRRQSKPNAKKHAKLTEAQQAEVDKAVRAAVIQFQEQVNKERTNQQYLDLETVDNILSEHIGPYILIGFNLNNEPIEIFNAKDPMEASALTDHFKKVFIERTVKHGSDFF